MPSKYTKEHLQEIHNLFDDKNEMYDLIYKKFYNNPSKEVQDSVKKLRTTIFNLTSTKVTALTQEEKEQLTTSLNEFVSNSTEKKRAELIHNQEHLYLLQSTENLLKYIDDFSKNVFKFDSENENVYAKTLVTITKNDAENDADKKGKKITEEEKKIAEETTKAFDELKCYRALAQKLVSDSKGIEYSNARNDLPSIEKVMGENYKKIRQADLGDIYEKLSQAYENVINTPLVKNTIKTNYLKRSGFNSQDLIRGLGMATIAASIFAFAPIAGFPFAGASASAILSFIGAQMLPIAGIAAGASAGASIVKHLFEMLLFKKVKEQIKSNTDTTEKKTKLFELSQNYTPKYVKQKGFLPWLNNTFNPIARILNFRDLRKCMEEFQKEAKKNDIIINFGNSPTGWKNYETLVEANQVIEERIGKRLIGRNPLEGIQNFFKEKRDKKNFVIPNSEIVQKIDSSLSQKLSSNNPLCEILGIEGQKQPLVKGRTSAKKPQTTIINQNTSQLVPSLARQEDSPSTENQKEVKQTIAEAKEKYQTIEDVFESLKDGTTEEEFIIESPLTQGKIKIKLTKDICALKSAEAKEVMTTLKASIEKGVDKTFGSRYQKGKKEKEVKIEIKHIKK